MRSIEKLGVWLITIWGFTLSPALGLQVFQQRVVVNSSELCVITISPKLIGWEKTPGSIREIEYSARMSNSPDLPEWLKYAYDSYSSTGYIYGVPPMRLVTLNLDVIAWNRYDNYDVRQLIVSLEIMRKEPMEYVMEMKIDNVNIRDLCLPKRQNDLISVLSDQLGWKMKNGNPAVPIYMASAVDIGENRVPLRPNEAEGVVIHFASDKDFSPALKKLQVEVSPLSKLRPCPRNLKRTSVEVYLRRHNFLVDWCSFRLVAPTETSSGTSEEQIVGGKGSGKDIKKGGSGLPTTSTGSASGGQAGISDGNETMDFVMGKGRYAIEPEVFQFTSEIPVRTYGYEALISTLLPGSIGGLIGIMLIVLLWGDREDESIDGDRLFFEAAFRMLFSIIRYNQNDNNDNTALGYAYHQINRQQHAAAHPHTEDSMLISRDVIGPDRIKPDHPLMEHSTTGASGTMGTLDRGEVMSTPLPPQYSETHPNGAPALIYAV